MLSGQRILVKKQFRGEHVRDRVRHVDERGSATGYGRFTFGVEVALVG